jgi:hypothetical protein
MSENIKKNAQTFFSLAKQAASELKDKAVEGYDKSGAKDEIEKRLKDAKEFMDESGISDKAEISLKKVQVLSELASDNFDKVSGKKILELVESRLLLQTQYNDILATKLDEALNRIEVLEKAIKGDL